MFLWSFAQSFEMFVCKMACCMFCWDATSSVTQRDMYLRFSSSLGCSRAMANLRYYGQLALRNMSFYNTANMSFYNTAHACRPRVRATLFAKRGAAQNFWVGCISSRYVDDRATRCQTNWRASWKALALGDSSGAASCIPLMTEHFHNLGMLIRSCWVLISWVCAACFLCWMHVVQICITTPCQGRKKCLDQVMHLKWRPLAA